MKLLALISRYWLGITLVLLGLITVASLWPLDSLPPVPGSDKTHHFIAYALLMFPAAYAKTKHWGVLVIGFALYSGVIELIQPYVNRYGEWLDLLANIGGLAGGIVLAGIIRWISTKAD